LASWYGPGFHGRKTANGEKYDQNAMTAAHKTLPLPSWVKVTRVDNGKSIIVRVNDRGPFAKGRIIDLSAAAAKKLGTQKSGLKKVRVQYLSKKTKEYVDYYNLKTPKGYPKANSTSNKSFASNAKPVQKTQPVQQKTAQSALSRLQSAQTKQTAKVNTSTAKLSYDGEELFNSKSANAAPQQPQRANANYTVQTATFPTLAKANSHATYVGSLARAQVKQASHNGLPVFKVLLGPVREPYNAENLLGKVKHMGFADARILVD